MVCRPSMDLVETTSLHGWSLGRHPHFAKQLKARMEKQTTGQQKRVESIGLFIVKLTPSAEGEPSRPFPGTIDSYFNHNANMVNTFISQSKPHERR